MASVLRRVITRHGIPLRRACVPAAARPDLLHLALPQKRQLSEETKAAISGTAAQFGELREVGLGSFTTPVGLIQNMVEICSASTGLPWVGGIVLTTIALRTALLPVVFGSMRNNTIIMNLRPEMELHSARMRQCQANGDSAGAQMAAENLNTLFKSHGAHPLKSFIPLLVNAPVFISFFIALRKMAELPVESMQTGGLLWFTDLTASDPYYILPLTASATMLATLELGSEGVKQQNQTMKNVFRFLAVAMLPVTVNFPAAVFVYWNTANLFSLSQLLILRIPGLKQRMGIPEAIDHPTPAKKLEESKGFLEDFKSGIKAAKEKAGIEDMSQQALRTAPKIEAPKARESASASPFVAPPRPKRPKKRRH